ncbi:MAG: RNA 3'-terminal phosphate cyclase [Candidatus Aenigmatarchaeota archaeon]
MILIDGSEGWGQVLRTSIALSALTLKPVKVINIRASRPKPGLMPQHLTGIKVAAEFCDAEVSGLEYGSMEIEFRPRKFNVKDKTIDIGTAGSISLLLQTLTPMLTFADKKTTLEIIGGTAGLGSPTIEFLQYVTFPILNKLGLPLPKIEILKQGFYPRGGGRVRITFEPVKLLTYVNLTNPGKILSIKGISVAGSLPESVAFRQAEAAKEVLKKIAENIDIKYYSTPTYSQGTSITLWAETENSVLGSDNLGKRGVRAEEIGREAAQTLIKSIESKASLDKFMADQIIPFIALAHGKSSITVEEITQHCLSNISVCEKILGCKFSIDKTSKRIEVEGISFTR